jgi:hypothetical protein
MGEDQPIAQVFSGGRDAPFAPCPDCDAFYAGESDQECQADHEPGILCPDCGLLCDLVLAEIGTVDPTPFRDDNQTGLLVTIGFTDPDPVRTYLGLRDTYQVGLKQTSITIRVLDEYAYGTALGWAEAVFAATNNPDDTLAPRPAAIKQAISAQVRHPLRPLAAGDTVTVFGQIWALQPDGWTHITS